MKEVKGGGGWVGEAKHLAEGRVRRLLRVPTS